IAIDDLGEITEEMSGEEKKRLTRSKEVEQEKYDDKIAKQKEMLEKYLVDSEAVLEREAYMHVLKMSQLDKEAQKANEKTLAEVNGLEAVKDKAKEKSDSVIEGLKREEEQIRRTLIAYEEGVSAPQRTYGRGGSLMSAPPVSQAFSSPSFEAPKFDMPSGFEMPSFQLPKFELPKIEWFQKGAYAVPRTGVYGLHRGEEIVPAGRASGGGDGLTIVNVFEEKMIPQIMAKYPNAIINPVLSSMLKNPVTQKIMKNAVRS
ncbi:hypothetical protein ACFL2J_08155, partial [Candidatus Omnitrophota bacterium]